MHPAADDETAAGDLNFEKPFQPCFNQETASKF
jgi:hypothetical protein